MAKFEYYNDNCLNVIDRIIEEHRTKAIIVSDPPFNIGYKYRSYKDNMEDENYYEMLVRIFGSAPSVVIHYPEALHRLSLEMKIIPDKVVSWVYPSMLPKQHLDIAFYGVKPEFRKIKQPYKNLTDKRIRKRIAEGSRGGRLYDWWEIPQVKNVSSEKTSHPCQMPLGVMNNVIGLLPEDSVIIDPFMGSGTTGCAVKKMNVLQGAARVFIGIEMDEEYFKLATERIEKYEFQIPLEELK